MSGEIFESLIDEFDLSQAETGEYFGEIDGHPAILKILSIDPPGMMFKIRIDSEDKHDIELGERLSGLMEAGKINVSVENGYGWLTFYNLTGFEAEDVTSLLDELVEIIEGHGLSLDAECAVCQSGESGRIYYCESRINRLCRNCLKEKEEQQLERNKKLAEVKTSSILFSLLGGAGFAVVWAAMWFLYDYMFVLYGTDEIEVSDYVLVVVALAAIVILSMTIGMPLRRFGIQNGAFLNVIASILVVASFVLGEILLAVIWAIKELETMTFITSIRYYILSWQSQTPMFKVIKIGLVIGSIVGVHFIAKKQKSALAI
jgi:hypothetical protein